MGFVDCAYLVTGSNRDDGRDLDPELPPHIRLRRQPLNVIKVLVLALLLGLKFDNGSDTVSFNGMLREFFYSK